MNEQDGVCRGSGPVLVPLLQSFGQRDPCVENTPNGILVSLARALFLVTAMLSEQLEYSYVYTGWKTTVFLWSMSD
jgi:hypothetical protein